MPGFLGDFMIIDIFTTHFSTLMKGLAFTFELAVVSMLCGSLLDTSCPGKDLWR